MKKVRNPFGGGAKTNLNGLGFEIETDLIGVLDDIKGISVDDTKFYFKGKCIGEIHSKHGFYKNFLSKKGVDWKKRISKKLLPDKILVNYQNKTIYVIEIKFQAVAGSVDEKLQTCDFKKRQYIKLAKGTGFNVEYVYLLNDFFDDKRYKDVFTYIHDVGCRYFIGEIPLEYLGLDDQALNA